MTNYKLGKLPAVRPYGLSDLAAYMQQRPPAPPASCAVPSVAAWPMNFNDQDGDCVPAGCAHALQAWNAQVGEHDAVPSEQAVLDQYLQITHGQDVGCNEASVLDQWSEEGLFGGNKIAAYAPVKTDSIPQLQSAVAFYGVCILGIACPESMQQQFAAGQPITVVPGSQIAGGHCIIIVGYHDTYVQVVTWGAAVNCSYPFLQAYLDEAWAVIPQEFVEAGRGPLLDLKALRADIKALQR